jgi:uncharacterized protein YdeI (YjbR/CyaY-like superfamily)
MPANDLKPVLFLPSAAEWERWLAENWSSSDGVRLQLRRKGSSLPGMTYAEALDVALCFGWIDTQANSLSDDHYLVAFTKRRSKSMWSQINRDHIARLTAEGRMRPPGLAEVERAKADGRWDAAYRQKDAPIPEDLAEALAANPKASTFFATLSAQNRFAFLYRIGSVKRAETRAAKIATYVSMLERQETLLPQPQQRPRPRPGTAAPPHPADETPG